MRTRFASCLVVVALVTALAVGGYSAWAAGTESKSDADPSAELFNEAKALAESGDYVAARAKLEKAAKAKPDDPEILNLLAFSQRKTGALTAAFKNYTRALELRPRFPAAREYLAEAHVQAALEQLAFLRNYGDEGAEHAAEVQRVLENALAAARGEGSLEDAAAGKDW